MSSEAAAELGRQRWKGVSKKKRKEHSKMMHAAKTPAERSAIAKKAAAARWGKREESSN